ncbi:MFS transporter, PAT family, beta-lactamase induction signal transducer AmpG [Desulfocicer vacuolatum DSM 3385]|uniref:MFS transporter, PAT family, beta-lactamase induction signal transducer AmpG n=1 Tax=Desulfocicer vacuolatum DSM 3385 TaxID=1121400 RepID=A0A1W2CQT0_9BACT|nr:AmpG family muropeptide MFS transporter [Desulfocicer vacuolatum]SMC87561.1 MFS transporter, PAT family, beta-lactamase induction signal transducer AmpG [Desulfocicer vacuolatum DSM 3385]
MVPDESQPTDVPIIKQILSRKMTVALIMGFSCGVPLLLTISVLQAWMKKAGVDLTVIGTFSLVGLPYTLKFVWAPLFDRFTLPFLGRRKGWLLVAQVALLLSIVLLGLMNPAKSPWMVAFAAFLVTFCSASQDIVVDAYRREDLTDKELGLGSSLYIYGYRAGMLLASGGGLILADHISFSMVYLIMAASLIPGMVATVMTPEPEKVSGQPDTLAQAVVEPLREYFSREGALLILLFVMFYKIGDTMASAMTTPFYLDVGFSMTEVGAVVKIFGFWATLLGTFSGGILMLKIGINRSLWVFGFLQALSTAGFAWLAVVGHSIGWLSGVIAFENLSSGMGTAAYVAFMAALTDKRFTATQYALLSSLMGIPRVLAAAPTGFFAKHLGWESFFICCTLAALPGMLLLMKCAPWNGARH